MGFAPSAAVAKKNGAARRAQVRFAENGSHKPTMYQLAQERSLPISIEIFWLWLRASACEFGELISSEGRHQGFSRRLNVEAGKDHGRADRTQIHDRGHNQSALGKFLIEIGPGMRAPDRPAAAKEDSGVMPMHTRRGGKVTQNKGSSSPMCYREIGLG